MAGVCGVWGESGLPGDEAVDTDVPAIMAGTLESCRLDDDDDRCNMVDEETESESAAWESLRRWYLDNWRTPSRRCHCD